ncbi:MAG: sugar phosphate nucleotidyltransferase, partial [Planctomycetota bacterium]
GKSLLRVSYERLASFLPDERIYVCTGEQHRAAILEDLPELSDDRLLGEPMGRDTSNAVGFSAAVLHKLDPDASFAVVTADHVIEPIPDFAAALTAGFDVVDQINDTLVTFGIVPTHGHTGLGYVHRGAPIDGFTEDGRKAFSVQAFKEKPDKPTADRYVESGRYYWNSGMFVWRADAILAQLEANLPDAHAGLLKIKEAWGTDAQNDVLSTTYPQLQKISIDFGVMESAAAAGKVSVVEMPVQWLDVGSWPALAETLDMDDHDNAVDADHLVALDCDGNIIMSKDPDHVVGLVGVSDMVIVHTKDCTLVCPKSDAQRVKELQKLVADKYGDRFR